MLRAMNLVKSFHDPAGGVVHAVAGLSLAVEPGVIYGLLGPNGAGKTTTLRILATLTRPDAGEVHIGDIDALRHPVEARARMAYVPAEGGLPARLSALEAVTLFGEVQGVPKAKDRAMELLCSLGAGAYVGRECAQLSTGMKRRVVLARALMNDPGLLLLDEPTDGLDVQGRLDVLQLIQSLAAERRAVVLSSHIMGEVERVCQRACIIHRGLKIAEGSLDELRALGGAEALDDAFVALLNAEPQP